MILTNLELNLHPFLFLFINHSRPRLGGVDLAAIWRNLLIWSGNSLFTIVEASHSYSSCRSLVLLVVDPLDHYNWCLIAGWSVVFTLKFVQIQFMIIRCLKIFLKEDHAEFLHIFCLCFSVNRLTQCANRLTGCFVRRNSNFTPVNRLTLLLID